MIEVQKMSQFVLMYCDCQVSQNDPGWRKDGFRGTAGGKGTTWIFANEADAEATAAALNDDDYYQYHFPEFAYVPEELNEFRKLVPEIDGFEAVPDSVLAEIRSGSCPQTPQE
jgi:hypothetical protein